MTPFLAQGAVMAIEDGLVLARALAADPGPGGLLRYEAAVYAGRAINPVQCELQSEGNVAFGVGQALFEELVFDGGQLQNGNLADYMVAYPADMPRELGVTILEDAAVNEIHGIGETGLPPVAPAIGNARWHGNGQAEAGQQGILVSNGEWRGCIGRRIGVRDGRSSQQSKSAESEGASGRNRPSSWRHDHHETPLATH